MRAKQSRPAEWLVGYLTMSAFGAIGPAILLSRYTGLNPWQGGLGFFALTMSMWGAAGVLYHEAGRGTDRWAGRFATVGQWLALLGLLTGLIYAVALGLQWLRLRFNRSA